MNGNFPFDARDSNRRIFSFVLPLPSSEVFFPECANILLQLLWWGANFISLRSTNWKLSKKYFHFSLIYFNSFAHHQHHRVSVKVFWMKIFKIINFFSKKRSVLSPPTFRGCCGAEKFFHFIFISSTLNTVISIIQNILQKTQLFLRTSKSSQHNRIHRVQKSARHNANSVTFKVCEMFSKNYFQNYHSCVIHSANKSRDEERRKISSQQRQSTQPSFSKSVYIAKP